MIDIAYRDGLEVGFENFTQEFRLQGENGRLNWLVGAFYGELVASGGKGGRPLSPKTVRYVHTTLRRALRDAVANGLVVRNVAAQARPPRARRVEMHTWTAEQVGTFLASAREDRLYPAWLLLATLGIRRSDSMTCGTRSRRSCWPGVSTPRWSARCWATPPSRLPWTPTATSSHRSSRKR